ncbi:MAG: NAD(P)/FAD-dependent oxidoreductase [Gammaproteobacteria bacterium]
MLHYDVVVVGGGAAGLMCAITAGQRGRRVLVIEASNKVGKKILMSGGGHCNFTNLFVEPDNFLSANPHFAKSALSRYTQWDFIALVEKHRIAYHEKKHGQLFCDDSSKNILAMLIKECDGVSIALRTSCSIKNIKVLRMEPLRFQLNTAGFDCTTESLVIATGALSIPKMGASGFGYDIAQQFELQVLPTRAGLVPLVFSNRFKEVCARLSGVSVDCRLDVHTNYNLHTNYGSNDSKNASFNEALLFSHRGITGPVVLQISSYWLEGHPVVLNLFPEFDIGNWFVTEKSKQPKLRLRSLLSKKLPKNLVAELENLCWPKDKETALADWPDNKLQDIANQLKHYTLKPSGTEGYRTAEVTVGGVDTDEISSKTMESKRQAGLYFVGEVMDVTGHLGGFNFQWAWASGYAAGCHV